jgi:hypothetical protein
VVSLVLKITYPTNTMSGTTSPGCCATPFADALWGELTGYVVTLQNLNAKGPVQSPSQGVKQGLLATERAGFEPAKACTLPVFETGAIDHSATSPVKASRF